MIKDVLGYEGIYRVDDMGYIYPVKPRNKYKTVLKPSSDKSGYQIVSLVKDGVKKTKTVHRIVIEAYKGKSSLDTNHINGDKADNRLANLEYVTKSQNTRHAISKGLFRPNSDKIAKEKRKPVVQYSLDGKLMNKYDSAHQASVHTGYNRGNISTACRLNKTFYGYRWEYAI